MFFKRARQAVVVFAEQLERLREQGYAVDAAAAGPARVSKGNLGAMLNRDAEGRAAIAHAGLVLGPEIAVLTDIGFQKVFLSASGRRVPALAEHLHRLHDFVQDLREALGLGSLYNQGLGTTNQQHVYDRVKDRDRGAGRRAWEKM